MKKYTVIQDGIKECGSACLLSIIRYYGGNVSLQKLLELTNTTKNGTNFYDLTLAANEIGLSSKAYQVDNVDKLYSVQKPFISQVIIDNYKHFVVVYKMYNQIITIMDPAKGMVKMSKKAFSDIWTGYILILEPYKKLPIYQEDNYLLCIIKSTLHHNIKNIIMTILITVLNIIFTCIYTYYFKIVIDNYVSMNNLDLLILAFIFIVILVIKSIIEYLRNNLIIYLNQKIDLSVITATVNKIIHLPYSYYKNKTTGEMVSRINDLMYVKNVILKLITTIFLDVLLLISISIILFILNFHMTIFLLFIAIIYLLLFIIYRLPIKNLTNSIQESSAKTNSLLVESMNGYATIKGLNIEDKCVNKINKYYLNMIDYNLNLNKLINSENLFKDLFEGIVIIFVIYIGMLDVMDKSMSFGTLVTYNALLFYYLTPIKSIFVFYKELYYAINSIRRVNNLMEYKYDKLDIENDLLFDTDIHINNLSFSYNAKNLVLNGITLDIERRSKTLLLGNSGSGKSTLLKLIYRYYNSERNKIFIGNNDLFDYNLLNIRKNIAYLSQNEFLYTDTIKNNIILDRNISDDKFLKICELLEISGDNMMGYDMMLEENGANISGGQRQKIILARTLLKDAKIILIDEGLNEMDSNLERRIIKKIFNYYSDKTFIIISHRNDNMDLFDRVLLLEDGSISKDLKK